MVKEYPELYDYYIKLRETDTDEIRLQCQDELHTQLKKLFVASKNMIALFKSKNYPQNEMLTTREEAKQQLKFFKHIISKGQANQNIVEFKLASSSKLAHVFTQVKIYEAANCADGS